MDWPLLAGLTAPERADVLAAARRRRYARGEVVFHEGDRGDALHLVAAGHLAVRVQTPMGDTATLAVLGPGMSFGELALLDADAERTATVCALEASETLVLTREQFSALCEAHPSVAQVLPQVLAQTVRRLSDHLLEALYVPVDKRVARRLLVLMRTYPAEGAGPVTIPLTQEDLAGLAGSSRPTVNQVLRKLEERGAIALRRGKVDILDPRLLAARAR